MKIQILFKLWNLKSPIPPTRYMCLQGIRIVVFSKTNIQSKIMNITIMSPFRYNYLIVEMGLD